MKCLLQIVNKPTTAHLQDCFHQPTDHNIEPIHLRQAKRMIQVFLDVREEQSDPWIAEPANKKR